MPDTDDSTRPPMLIRLLDAAERFSVLTACIGGGILAVLAFFITFDALGRGYGGFYSGATDEISGYAMCLAVTWTLAYTLTIDKHVRVDLIFGMVSPRARRMLDRIALLLLTVFAFLLAANSLRMAMESFEFGILSTSVLQVPVGIPQSLMAVGFMILALQGAVTFLVGLIYPSALKRSAALERRGAPEQFEI